MSTLFKTALGSIILLIALTAQAFSSSSTLKSESSKVSIGGKIHTHYLRMGHSTFYGNLDIRIQDDSGRDLSYKVQVDLGDIQDDYSVSTNSAHDQFGQLVKFNLDQTGLSVLQIGNEVFHFYSRFSLE